MENKCKECNQLYDTAQHLPVLYQCGHTFCRTCVCSKSPIVSNGDKATQCLEQPEQDLRFCSVCIDRYHQTHNDTSSELRKMNHEIEVSYVKLIESAAQLTAIDLQKVIKALPIEAKGIYRCIRTRVIAKRASRKQPVNCVRTVLETVVTDFMVAVNKNKAKLDLICKATPKEIVLIHVGPDPHHTNAEQY